LGNPVGWDSLGDETNAALPWPSETMNDLLYIGIIAVFFIVSAAYVRGCESL
jgi:hypothetical protein